MALIVIARTQVGHDRIRVLASETPMGGLAAEPPFMGTSPIKFERAAILPRTPCAEHDSQTYITLLVYQVSIPARRRAAISSG
jgi:hypothetical protein